MQLQDLDVKGRRVLLRVDFNVPIEKSKIQDDTRIVNTLPTLKYLISSGAKVILLSHLGRPLKDLTEKGNIRKKTYSLQPVYEYLKDNLDTEVIFDKSDFNSKLNEKSKTLDNGSVMLLENTRFNEGEKKGDRDLAEKISELGDYYVNDAFGTAHRAHASTAVVAEFFDAEHKAFGMLMQKEIENASKILESPAHPYVIIIGGAKISDKIDLIHSLIEKVDKILIGGGMAYTFIKSLGGEVGDSLVEIDKIHSAKEIIQKARNNNTQILLPMDSVIADEFAPDANIDTSLSREIPDGWMGLDIGIQSREHFAKEIKDAKTILWNGPMGVFEYEAFAEGTYEIAKSVAAATDSDTFSMVGGGDSVSAVKKSGVADKISFISTGGGAMLEFLQGRKLPGIEAIKN